MMRAIGYTRVSSLEQAESGISLAAQAERIASYCRLQDWEYVGLEIDDGHSGKDLKRPGIQRLLEEGRRRTRGFDCIVVTKLDRLTRSMRDLFALTAAADRQGFALVSITEAVDTATPTGQLFRTIITALSEWERGTIAERTREALAYKRQRGERVGSIPFGFSLAADGRQLVPDQVETPILRRIVRERTTGASFERIADRLNADAIATKCGGRWYAASVRSVLLTQARREKAQAEAGRRTTQPARSGRAEPR